MMNHKITNLEYYNNTPFKRVIDIYHKAIEDKKIGANVVFCEWLNMEYKKTKTMYYWEGKSDDGCYRDTSLNSYSTQKDCYNDMLKAASQKIVWNVEWEDVAAPDCDIENEEFISGRCGIMHHTEYLPNKIIDHSYSGEYVWEIKTKEVVE